MQSISAKELRLNLKEILLKVENGQSFEVIYHSRPIGDFVPKRKQSVTKDWYRDLLELRKNLSVNKTKKKFDAVTMIRKERD